MKKTLLTIGTFILAGAAIAQNPGDLDTGFGIGGYTLADPYANTGESYWDLITLSDDKIIKVGYTDDGVDTDILLSKFTADGIPDSTFGVNGFVEIDLSSGGSEDARGITELPSGQLLITGYVQSLASLDAYVMRLNDDGSIDGSFGTNGHALLNTGDNLIAYGKSVISSGTTIYVGGAALVGGQSDVFVCKLTMGGGIDNSFSSNGYATMDIDGGDDQLMSMDMKANGSFVFGGFADSSGVQIGYVSSLTQFGTPTTFGTNGVYRINYGSGPNEINDLYVNANDDIVFTGDQGTFPNVNGFVGKLTGAGVPEGTFGTNGFMNSDPGATTALFFRGVAETADGGVIAVGNYGGASNDIYALLLEADGSPNPDFGGNGDVQIPFSISVTSSTAMGCALQSDGKIVIGGFLESQDFIGTNMFLIRLYPFEDNSSVFELEKEEVIVYPNPVVSQFRIKGDVTNVELIDGNGRVLKQWEAQESYSMPAEIASGVYTIRVKTNQSVGLARIIVK